MIEKQVIVEWYRPEEKLPSDYYNVIVTVSGRDGNIGYDHAFMIASYAPDGCGWVFEGASEDADITVVAWCDLDPFGWRG